MIVLDTHTWIWWISAPESLSEAQRIAVDESRDSLIVSAISVWEVAKLVELGRLELDRPVLEWIFSALNVPGVRVQHLTPEIIVDSTALPGDFHRDPADQLIVATARTLGVPVVTSDRKIVAYRAVESVS